MKIKYIVKINKFLLANRAKVIYGPRVFGLLELIWFLSFKLKDTIKGHGKNSVQIKINPVINDPNADFKEWEDIYVDQEVKVQDEIDEKITMEYKKIYKTKA